MTTIAISRPATNAAPVWRPKLTHPKALIATDAGHRLAIPYAPNETSLTGIAHTYAIVPRPGRKPLVLPDSPGLRTLSFDLYVAHQDHQVSVEAWLTTLRAIAVGAHRVTLSNLGADTHGAVWRLSELTQQNTARQHGTNAVTRATASLTFLEVSDVAVKVGPITGGAKTPAGTTTKAAGGTTVRTYTVARGDTLTGIAHKLYGDGSLWPTIAKANKITDPRTLKVGQRLTIPPKP